MDDDSFWYRSPELLRHLADRNRDNGVRISYFVLGDWRQDAPTAMALELPPGGRLNHHAHDCERLEIIVKGSLDVGDRLLRPGDVMMSGRGELYGPHVAGPGGCTSFEVFSRFTAAYQPIYETPSGRVMVDGSDPDAARPTTIL
jgi:hypothetical protein